MFCSNCGKEIRDNSNFCPYCGVVKRAIPSETVKQTPVQDTSASTKKNGSKAFKFCPNCGKAIGGNSDFCPYCGSAERAILSKTVEQTSVQDTSVAAWQNRFKDFWKRRSLQEKQAMVIIPLIVLSILGIMVYHAIKNRYTYTQIDIDSLVESPEKFVGRDICVKGWQISRLDENRTFGITDRPNRPHEQDVLDRWILVRGWKLEKLPEYNDAVSVRGEWRRTKKGNYYPEADKVDYLDD